MATHGDDDGLRAIVFGDPCTPGVSDAAFDGDDSSSEALISLHGCPVLHWQLFCLSAGGVTETLVLSRSDLADVTPRAVGPMAVSNLCNASWRSPGDALRDVDSRVAIRPRNDFVLMQYGALTNVDIGGVVRRHRELCAIDPNWLVTLVLARGFASCSGVAGVQQLTQSLCHYVDSRDKAPIQVDSKSENAGLAQRSAVDMITDFEDIGVDVCGPAFLVEFRENFDFDDIRDYVRAKLDGGEAELLGNRIHAQLLDPAKNEYGIRVNDMRPLLQASQDVFDGWMLPITAEKVAGRVMTAQTRISYEKGVQDCCLELGASVSNTAVVERCVVERDARIADGAVVKDSVVSKGCQIGPGAVVTNSILCSGATVDDGARNVVVTESSRKELVCAQSFAGDGHQSDEEDELEGELDDGPEGELEDTSIGVSGLIPTESSAAEDSSVFDRAQNEMDGESLLTQQEISETVERGVETGADLDAIQLEVRHLIREHELRTGDAFQDGLCSAVLGIAKHLQRESPIQNSTVENVCQTWKPLLDGLAGGHDPEGRKVVDVLADELCERGSLLMYIWSALYDNDVIEGEDVLGWAKDVQSGAERFAKCAHLLQPGKNSVKKYVDWLEESDESE